VKELNDMNRQAMGQQIYKKLPAIGQKLKVALFAGAKERAEADAAEIKKKKDFPRVLASVDVTIKKGWYLIKRELLI